MWGPSAIIECPCQRNSLFLSLAADAQFVIDCCSFLIGAAVLQGQLVLRQFRQLYGRVRCRRRVVLPLLCFRPFFCDREGRLQTEKKYNMVG